VIRSWVGYALAVIAAVGVLVGLFFIFAAGGNEPEPIRFAGVQFLVIAAVAGVFAALVLRPRR
jgi:hypothetical protein